MISDSGPIFSLAIIDKLEILSLLFEKIRIPLAVWDEVTLDKTKDHYHRIQLFFRDKKQKIKGFNELVFLMDYGESESLILYKELNADFLLIYDKKARSIAESFGIRCIGTIGLLMQAKNKGFIDALKPLFEALIEQKRYYSIDLLNTVLERSGENRMEY